MKGITRMIPRVPQQVKHMLNKNSDGTDMDFKYLEEKVEKINTQIKSLITDSEKFKKTINNMIKHQENLGTTMLDLYKPLLPDSPISSNEEISVQRNNSFQSSSSSPANTRNVEAFIEKTRVMSEQISPHLQSIDAHIIIPTKRYSELIQSIKRVLKKRSHKSLDYERHKESLEKMNEKQNRSLDDERKLAKTRESFTNSEGEFKMYDEQLRLQLPTFFANSTELFDSCLISFYTVQKDIYHIMYVYFYELANECGINLNTSIVKQYESYNCEALLEDTKVDNLIPLLTASSTVNKHNSFLANGAASTTAASTTYSTSNSDDLPPYEYVPVTSSFVAANQTSSPPSYKRNSIGSGSNNISAGSYSTSNQTYPSLSQSYSAKSSTAAAAAAAAASGSQFQRSMSQNSRPMPPPPAPKPKFVVALYDFTAQGPGDLTFKRGDRIEIVTKTENNNEWWTGKFNGQIGQFPGNYVE